MVHIIVSMRPPLNYSFRKCRPWPTSCPRSWKNIANTFLMSDLTWKWPGLDLGLQCDHNHRVFVLQQLSTNSIWATAPHRSTETTPPDWEVHSDVTLLAFQLPSKLCQTSWVLYSKREKNKTKKTLNAILWNQKLKDFHQLVKLYLNSGLISVWSSSSSLPPSRRTDRGRAGAPPPPLSRAYPPGSVCLNVKKNCKIF